MTTLAFLAAVAAIIILVLALEADSNSPLKIHRPTGLLTWLTSGNWPAKVGGALIIVGVGALLRFALIEIDVPPQMKLISGTVISLALGFGSMFVGSGPARRPVSLALGGAAFGVAYLTAYSAFGLFNYVSSPTGLALLGLTSVGAGIFAVTRSALSLAVLSMIGAYLAPAFAVSDPGPTVVYGYYAGASLLTLAMVTARGWRPLIHLSFLFTLAGGVFFAWTSQYYTPQYADVMLPMLLLLTAVHVAMPIFERSPPGGVWVQRLDLVYTVTLPAVAAGLALWISPTRIDLSTTLLALGVIWAVAATGLQLTTRRGAAVHVVIAVLLSGLGTAALFSDLPWELISLGFAVATLAIAARRPQERVHSVLAGLVLFLGALHVLVSLATSGDAGTFGPLIERLIGAAFIIYAGAICRRIRQSLDTLLLAVGICWGVFAIGLELVKHELAAVELVLHWVLLLVGLSVWIPGRKIRVADRAPVPVALLILASGAWAAFSASPTVGWISLFLAPLVLIGVAVRPEDPDRDVWSERAFAALVAPVVAGIWGFSIAHQSGYVPVAFALASAAAVGIATLLIGRKAPGIRGTWVSYAGDAMGVAFACVIFVSTLFYISRAPSAVVLEGLCVTGLALVTFIRRADERPIDLSTAVCMIAGALVMQAHLLRWLTTASPLSIQEIFDLQWPAVVSLLWAMAGSALTIWSRRVLSRTLWISGAVLLVAAAVKLVLVDFGSLGQLANILAVIAAGGMFLLVGWLAPIPPAASSNPAAHDEIDASNRRTAWTFGIILVIAIVLSYVTNRQPGISHSSVEVSAAAPADLVRWE